METFDLPMARTEQDVVKEALPEERAAEPTTKGKQALLSAPVEVALNVTAFEFLGGRIYAVVKVKVGDGLERSFSLGLNESVLLTEAL